MLVFVVVYVSVQCSITKPSLPKHRASVTRRGVRGNDGDGGDGELW